MFELFAQGERSIARSEGGLGIGLTVVQKLAEMHGGSVTARSEGPGKGSEFIVTLPAATAPAVGTRPPETLAPRAAGLAHPRRRRQRGHGTRDGQAPEAPRQRRADGRTTGRRPSRRPESSGPSSSSWTSACRAWTATRWPARSGEEPRCKAAVIIAVSGYGQEDDRRRSREAGFDHHLVKPVDFDRLVSLMAQV